jgi:hypothetical protein
LKSFEAYSMCEYDAAGFESRAIAGEWKAAISVLSRASLKPEVLQRLMVDEAHTEVRIALAMRDDVTPEQLQWCAHCDSAFLLNRLVSHPKTPLSTVKDIRDRSADRDGDVWTVLHEYAERVMERRVMEAGGLHSG